MSIRATTRRNARAFAMFDERLPVVGWQRSPGIRAPRPRSMLRAAAPGYVTGLAAGGSVSLATPEDTRCDAATQTQLAVRVSATWRRALVPVRSDADGPPQSDPITVHSEAAARGTRETYDNRSRRTATRTHHPRRHQLAIDVHPPTSPAGEPDSRPARRFRAARLPPPYRR